VSQTPQDTIVAIATPPGEGAVGIVRLSGPSAVRIASTHVVLQIPLQSVRNFHVRHGQLRLNDRLTDEVLVFVARQPNSYTGEDTVELQCHGSPVLLNALIRSLVDSGARHAEPGEFTKRAFLCGRIDLTQAEAVADLVSAKTDYGLESAFFQLRGGLKDRFGKLSHELRQTKTLLEAGLDFSDDVTLDPELVTNQLDNAVGVLKDQIESYASGKLVRDGARVTLCGKPNVGKSSLLNALLGQERAIVTEIPGTTRDTIEESIDINGMRTILTDTAGIRDTDDPVEKEGTRRSDLAISSADLILAVCDGNQGPTEDDRNLLETYSESVLVLNKADLGISDIWGDLFQRQSIEVSAKTREGLESLRALIGSSLLSEQGLGAEMITNERHVSDLRIARTALERAAEAIRGGAPGEVVSFEIEEGLTALSGIVGETTAQDILDRIFSQFCIGK
jgi:tRNA modification GTPase